MEARYRIVRQQLVELEQEAEQLRREVLRQVIAELRSKVREYDITPQQLFGPELSALVRFRDPRSGQTWNGFGRPPHWIRGKDRAAFRVEQTTVE